MWLNINLGLAPVLLLQERHNFATSTNLAFLESVSNLVEQLLLLNNVAQLIMIVVLLRLALGGSA
jgi:hypothetical protein